MKKTFVLAAFLSIAFISQAQIAQWVIPPVYDSIYFATGTDLIVTDSLSYKIYWNKNGKRVFETSETIHPFREGIAVTTNGDQITGFYDTKGRYTKLAEQFLQVAHNAPYFNDKNLLVKQHGYCFVDPQGTVDQQKFNLAYPFSNGYAVCRSYKDPQKKKGAMNYLIDKNREVVTFTIKGKPVNPENIEFLTSVNDEQTSVVVVKEGRMSKQYIYLFKDDNTELKPWQLPWQLENDPKSPQAVMDSEITPLDSTRSVFCALFGKYDTAYVFFDQLLIPDLLYTHRTPERIKAHSAVMAWTDTDLSLIKEDGKYGIQVKGKTILPPQFDAITYCFDNLAFVKNNNKQGLLMIDKDAVLNVSINKGNKIAFRHAKYEEVEIRIDMPSSVDPEKIKLEVDPDSGCEIDPMKKSEKGDDNNRVTYKCDLTIPKDLTVNDTTIVYPIQLYLDGIKLQQIDKEVTVWHCKYFDVDIDDSYREAKTDSTLMIDYNIDVQRLPSETYDYSYDVSFHINSREFDVKPTTNTRGICKIPKSYLNDGINILNIKVKEDGCPPINFPFIINYTKPVPKSKHKAAVKENISIEKKTGKEDPKNEAPFTPNPDD